MDHGYRWASGDGTGVGWCFHAIIGGCKFEGLNYWKDLEWGAPLSKFFSIWKYPETYNNKTHKSIHLNFQIQFHMIWFGGQIDDALGWQTTSKDFMHKERV